MVLGYAFADNNLIVARTDILNDKLYIKMEQTSREIAPRQNYSRTKYKTKLLLKG